MRRGLVLLVGLSMVVAACSTGSGQSSGDEARNVALPGESAPGELHFVSNDDGTATSCVPGITSGTCPLTVSLRKAYEQVIRERYAKLVLSPAPTPPSKTVMSEIARVARDAGAAMVIARLPVAFSPAETGIAHRNGVKLSDSVWKGSSLRRQSNDPAIAQATIALANRLSRFSGYSSRTVDAGRLFASLQGESTTSKSTRSITSSAAFAQLGAVPFVRMLVTPAEVETLLGEKLIADVELEAVTTMSDAESSSIVGVTGWTREDRVNGWWDPALTNPPTGGGAIVAISDSGVAAGHPAFGNRVMRGACFDPADVLCNLSGQTTNINLSAGGPCRSVAECDHGTHVAGIAAGAGSTLPDGTGVPQGLAPAARIVSYRTCIDPVTVGDFRADCTVSAAIAGMGDAGSFISLGNNVVSFNMSHGLSDRQALRTAISTLAAADVIVVHANGNGSRRSYCAVDTPGLYVVSNMEKDGTPRHDTDFSPACTDLWAPGTDIKAAAFAGGPTSYTVEEKSGASMAAPHVAGAAALLDESFRRVASSSGAASLTGNFDEWSGISHPWWMLADDRSGATNVSKPVLSLRRVPQLLEPSVARTAWGPGETDEYRRDMAAMTPESWTFDADNDVHTVMTTRDAYVNFDGLDDAGRLVKTVERPALFMFIAIHNGTLKKHLLDGRDRTGEAKRISRGPLACTSTGWTEVWTLVTADVGQNLVIEVDGPSTVTARPDGTVFVVEEKEENARSAEPMEGWTTEINLRPVAVDAGDTLGTVRPVTPPWESLSKPQPDLELVVQATKTLHSEWLSRRSPEPRMPPSAGESGDVRGPVTLEHQLWWSDEFSETSQGFITSSAFGLYRTARRGEQFGTAPVVDFPREVPATRAACMSVVGSVIEYKSP